MFEVEKPNEFKQKYAINTESELVGYEGAEVDVEKIRM